MSRITALEGLLAGDDDNALLHYALGMEYLGADRAAEAAAQLRKATALAPGHLASWKLLGKAELARGQAEEARRAWTRGIEAAGQSGHRQAQKEMMVFLRRLDRRQDQDSTDKRTDNDD